VKRVGADETINVRSNGVALERFAGGKGFFDVIFECSGSGAAIASAIPIARPGATLVQVGIGGAETPVPLNAVVAKEITLRGTFRFDVEFAWAVNFIASGAIDVRPLLTDVIPLADAVRAFELAGDRSKAMKVQIAL
jgi:L-idonate 5-dehydrogenase